MTTEDGSTVSLTSFSENDVYTGNEILIGFAESGNEICYIYNANSNLYVGQALTADDAVTSLGTAIAIASQQ